MLSIVIPVYNRERLVSRAVRSVLDQQVPPGWSMELLVVDDGSTDGTGAVLRDLEREYGPPWGGKVLRILSRPRGGTPGGARNYGVAHARGEVLAFLDSDDEWLPEKLLRQIPLHEGGEVLTHTRERWIRDGREISQGGRRFSRHRRSGDLLEDALVKCIIGPSTVMISRDVWERSGGFREDLEIAEDYEYWLRLTALTAVAYLDLPLTVKYAGHGDQLSEKYGQIETFRIRALRPLVEERWFARHRDGTAQAMAERELLRKALIYAAGARKRGRIAEAEEYERLARRYS
ncbi:MAG: glycosyltransferase [Spirochaetaceae bacterium]|nr:MAG: glycosyltransferase [Spirochaetaceae bacterium]